MLFWCEFIIMLHCVLAGQCPLPEGHVYGGAGAPSLSQIGRRKESVAGETAASRVSWVVVDKISSLKNTSTKLIPPGKHQHLNNITHTPNFDMSLNASTYEIGCNFIPLANSP